MEIDFSALASRVAAFSDVLGCIILSTDGLVLGFFPPGDEDGVKPAWLKFAALGEPERGFVKFSDAEMWAYVQSGPYAAFATATGSTRPGVLLDHMEQVLLVAGESRDRRAMARTPGRVDLARSTPKALPGKEGAGSATEAEKPALERATAEALVGRMDPPAEGEDPSTQGAEAGTADGAPSQEESEVDRVVLAREFAGLLQEDQPSDEDNA
jgi:hypothetical protein